MATGNAIQGAAGTGAAGTAGGGLSGTYPNPVVVLDSTAADIQPDGAQAAGAAGLPADAGHVHQEKAWNVLLLEPSGALAVTMPRRMCNVADSMTSGSAFFTSIGLAKGLIVANITMIVGSSPQSGGTHGWYALTDSAYKVLAVSADQTGGTTWAPAGTAVTLAMGTPYTVPAAGVYYVVMSQSDTVGAPSIVAYNAIAQANVAPILAGSITGQSTPPAVGATLTTPSAGTSQLFAYVS